MFSILADEVWEAGIAGQFEERMEPEPGAVATGLVHAKAQRRKELPGRYRSRF